MAGIVIGGTHSGCGKTTVTLGVLAALSRQGRKVQAFKAGPDFIDTGLHSLITGRPSRNLDLWMCGEDYVREVFGRHSRHADLSVVEGVMGLYDGDRSTAALARIIGAPVVLVVDAYGMAESAGAVVQGFAGFSEGLVAGVIFNRVSSEGHYSRIRGSIHGVPVLGYLPRDLDFEIPERHLGLTIAEERPISDHAVGKLADAVLTHIDVEAMIRQAFNGKTGAAAGETPACAPVSRKPVRMAVATDEAFCFYYEDNLDLLKAAGAEILRFSPLRDPEVPAGADFVYIGGGYPELHAARLSANTSMLRSVKEWSEGGKPLYAECGGLMYLSRGITDFEGHFYPMAGVFPFKTAMRKKLSRLGYRSVSLREGSFFGPSGTELRGHEFHYSEIAGSAAEGPAKVYTVRDGSGRDTGIEGYRFRNTLASYIHLHFGSNPGCAQNLVHFAKERAWSISSS